jgi:hypothetical protein
LRRWLRSPIVTVPAALAVAILLAAAAIALFTRPDADLLFDAALEAHAQGEAYTARAAGNPLAPESVQDYTRAAQAYAVAVERFELLVRRKPEWAPTVDPLLGQSRAALAWCRLKLPASAWQTPVPVAAGGPDETMP